MVDNIIRAGWKVWLKNSLKNRLGDLKSRTVLVLLLSLVLFLCLTVIMMIEFKDDLHSLLKEKAVERSKYISARIRRGLVSGAGEGQRLLITEKLMKELMDESGDVYNIHILRKSGKWYSLVSQAVKSEVGLNNFNINEVKLPVLMESGQAGRFKVINLVKIMGEPLWLVVVEYYQKNLVAVYNDSMQKMIMYWLLGTIMTFAVLYYLLGVVFFDPFDSVKKMTMRLAMGDTAGPAQEAGTGTAGSDYPIGNLPDQSMGTLAGNLEKVRLTMKARSEMFARELEITTIMGVIDQTVLSSTSIADIADLAVRIVGRFLKADRTSLVLLEQQGLENIGLLAAYNKTETTLHPGLGLSMNSSRGLALLFKGQVPVFINDLIKDKAEFKGHYPVDDQLIAQGVRSTMLIPLIVKGQVAGSINFGKVVVSGFSEEDMMAAVTFSNQIAIALENCRMYTVLKQETEKLNTMLEISRVLCSKINMAELLDNIVDCVQKLIKVDSVSVLLLDKSELFLETQISTIDDPRFGKGVRINLGEKVAGMSALKGRPFIIQDGVDERLFENYVSHEKNIYSSIVAPLDKENGRLIGVLCINSYLPERRFSEEDLKFLQLLTAQIALALENAAFFEELHEANLHIRESHLDMVRVLADALETKEGYADGHGLRMLHYADMITDELNISDLGKEEIIYGTLLHDIGKIATPDAILNKPGRLTGEEMEVMMEHPARGADILKSIDSLKGVAKIVYHHQECFDGSGYPDGISGENIPIGSRIVAVLDAYDAMTNDRVYRGSLGRQYALDELREYAGKQFDPLIVSCFVSIMENEESYSNGNEELREII